MPRGVGWSRRRAVAICSLALLIATAVSIRVLVSVLPPYLQQHRAAVKALRARMRGARYLGDAGVVLQTRANDCGAAALAMTLRAHGVERSLSEVSGALRFTPAGVSMLDLRLASSGMGVP